MRLVSESSNRLVNRAAIRNLKLLDPKGETVAQDETQTREWYQKLALAGDAAAMYTLGLTYADGRGVPQDYAKAAEWYQKAAQMGNGDAMNNLGCLYASGQGVAADAFKAREWYRKAAEAGSAEGSQNLKGLTSIDTSHPKCRSPVSRSPLGFPTSGRNDFFCSDGSVSGRLPSHFRAQVGVKFALLLLWINLSLTLARLGFASLLDQNSGIGIGCFLGGVGCASRSAPSFCRKGQQHSASYPAAGYSAGNSFLGVRGPSRRHVASVGNVDDHRSRIKRFRRILAFRGESGPWFASRLRDHRDLCATISLLRRRERGSHWGGKVFRMVDRLFAQK